MRSTRRNKLHAGRWTGVLSRSGHFRHAPHANRTSSDRITEGIAGRKARHDQVAMFLLRKDFGTVLPARRAIRVARRRRELVLLALCTILWWIAARLLL